MRFGWAIVALCALLGPSLASLAVRSPTETLREIGLHIKGEERREWLLSVIRLKAGLEHGLTVAEFNSKRSEIAAAAAVTALMERLPADNQFLKDNADLLASLSRTHSVWKEKFPEYPNVCNLKSGIGWDKDYCGAIIIAHIKDEGLPLGDDDIASLKAGKASFDKILGLMMSSNSDRLGYVIATHR